MAEVTEITLRFSPTYTLQIDSNGNTKSIRCEGCGRTSHHPEDVRQRFCGHCHVFHNDIPIAERLTWVADRKKQPELL